MQTIFARQSMAPPKLFFFDVDGTIIGDITPQVCEWLILRHLGLKTTQYRKNLIAHLANGLMRPDLALFIDTLKEKHKHAEMFIFTAADPVWAAFLIPCIESVIGFKFNRPIFTRKHCENHGATKSLTHVAKIAHRTVGTLREYKIEDFKKSCVLIDNSHVIKPGEEARWITCPTYAYMDVYDVLRQVPEELLAQSYPALIPTLRSHGFYVKKDEKMVSYHTFKQHYYDRLSQLLVTSSPKKDAYWTHLGHLIHHIDHSHLKDSTIRKINNGLAKLRHRDH